MSLAPALPFPVVQLGPLSIRPLAETDRSAAAGVAVMPQIEKRTPMRMLSDILDQAVKDIDAALADPHYQPYQGIRTRLLPLRTELWTIRGELWAREHPPAERPA